MNTKILPDEIRKLLNQPRQLAYLLGLAVVIALGAVLFLTVLRVQNAKDTIDRPQAGWSLEFGCNNGDCGDCAILATGGSCDWGKKAIECLKKVKQNNKICSGPADFNGVVSYVNPPIYGPTDKCQANKQTCGGDCVSSYDFANSYALANSASCVGGGGGGNNVCGGTEDPACVKNCVDNIRVGNCSYCKSCCGAGGGNCTKTSGGGGTVTVLVKNGDGSSYSQGGTVRMTATSACSSCNANCADPVCNPNREKAYSAGSGSVSWSDSSKGASYDFTFVGGAGGGCTATAGGQCTITIGGGGNGCQNDSDCGNKVCVDGACVNKNKSHFECVSSACKRVAGTGSDQNGCVTVGAACNSGNTCVDSQCPTGQACFNNTCQVYHLGCGTDSTCTKLSGAGQNTCASVGVGCDGGGTCVDSQCGAGQACFGGSCKAYHLGCANSNVCAKIEGAGANTSGCAVAGQVCGGELGSCWGNGGLNGRCVDCNGDGIINILDFSCLACNWKEKFAPDENPSCRTSNEE